MRKRLEKSSVAQCLDGCRLTGRLHVPGSKTLVPSIQPRKRARTGVNHLRRIHLLATSIEDIDGMAAVSDPLELTWSVVCSTTQSPVQQPRTIPASDRPFGCREKV